MGAVSACCDAGFSVSVVVDAATLPKTREEETLVVGQRFVVNGLNFNRWPSEIVLGYNENFIKTQEYPGEDMMVLVERTDTQLVFEVVKQYKFTIPHDWIYFATPLGPERTILQYETT